MSSHYTHILIIDDDMKLNELLKNYLLKFNMKVSYTDQPEEGLRLFHQGKPHLIILDIMLPGTDGFQVLKTIRKTSSVPIIMLTARGEVSDKVLGLETGADDYLNKPFEPRELVARIQSILRRIARLPLDSSILAAGALQVDLNKKMTYLHGKIINLTTTEFEILAFFMKNAGTVLSRDAIMNHLKGIDCDAFNRSIDILVSRIRKKIHDSSKHSHFFKTMWGTGYLFIEKVKISES
jgi:two-component system phosphate regulon response regulator OmpR